jgi:hypothetical protein
MTPRARRWALAMTTTLAAAACGDREPATAVHFPSDERVALATAGSGDIVGVLKRTEALASGLSATGVIGPNGGHLEIAGAGLRVRFARGAVLSPTPITVTAVGGRIVAYKFQPHGLVFRAPVTVRQSLRGTMAWKNPLLAARLEGSYFDKLIVDATAGYARSDERRPAWLTDNASFLEFSIEHFSGYIVSFGKTSVEVEVNVEIDTR